MSNIPYVIEQTNRSERSYDIFSRLLKDRIIFIGEEINNISADIVIAQLLYLESENSTTDIQLYINSPGGSVQDGLAIVDTMNYVKCDIATTCIGMAASMGAFILAAGTKGKRFSLPNSEIMLHQPLGGIKAPAQATDIEIMANNIIKTKIRLNQILSENTGKTIGEIENATNRDFYMNVEEALNYGIIDRILVKK